MTEKEQTFFFLSAVIEATSVKEETNNTLIYANRFQKKPVSDTIDKLRSEIQRYKKLYEDLKKSTKNVVKSQ